MAGNEWKPAEVKKEQQQQQQQPAKESKGGKENKQPEKNEEGDKSGGTSLMINKMSDCFFPWSNIQSRLGRI